MPIYTTTVTTLQWNARKIELDVRALRALETNFDN
jgi:hypothetical protein